MKVFVILFCFVALSAACDKVIEKYLSVMKKCSGLEDKDEVVNYNEECMMEKDCGCYFSCMLIDTGVMDDAGNVNKDKIIEISNEMLEEMADEIGSKISKQDIERIIHTCIQAAEDETDVCLKAAKIPKCFMQEMVAIMRTE